MDRFALFATPLFVFDLPDLSEANPMLAAALVEERRGSPGLQRSNVGGWHSRPDLAQRADPNLRRLMQSVVDHVAGAIETLSPPGAAVPRFRYQLQAWAMVMQSGDYTIVHAHGDAHFSTAYYVDAGDAPADDPHSGLLAFVDPRSGGRPVPELDLFPSTFTVRPRTGMLAVFPGWLPHYVHCYRGQRPRITISCNVVLEPASRPSPVSGRLGQ